MKEFTEEEVRNMLRAICADRGGQRRFACRHQVSEQYISDVVKGRRDVSALIAEAMGGKRVVVFRFPEKEEANG